MGRIWWAAAAIFAVVPVTDQALADDSCWVAGDGRCQEPVLGNGYCAPATDSTDCAGAYVIDDSATRRLDGSDVWYLSDEALRLARNEIFARHGYRFDSADLQAFFAARSWYSPAGQDVSLSAVEQANVAVLRAIEDGGPVPQPVSPGLPPWASWRADVVRASGFVDSAVVDGVRARVTDAEWGRTLLIRPDLEDALSFAPGNDDEWGAITWWGLFPPVLLDPFVHGYGIVPKPLGRDTFDGEQVTRVRLDWESEEGYETVRGEALLTDDGIFVLVDVGGVYAECCGGDTGIPWTLDYRLEDLQRGRPEPSELAPPDGLFWTFPG
jgi:hypothetical protein